MKSILVWNIPLRIFHALFAFSAAGAFAIAVSVDHESAIFPLHMLLGLTAAALLVARLAISLAGERHHRLRDLFFPPVETGRYLFGSLAGKSERYVGHNPGTGMVAIVMYILVPLLVWTGIAMGRGVEAAEDAHELLANILLGAMMLHLLGIALHTVRHREWIGLAMLTGRKRAGLEPAIPSSRPFAGLLLAVLVFVWCATLFAKYDRAARTVVLPVLGATLQLGEAEGRDGESRPYARERRHDDDDD